MSQPATEQRASDEPALSEQRRDPLELWPSHTLALTLDREDAWLLESTRWLAEAQGVRTQEEFVNALLAEGWTTFIAWSETTGQDIDRCLLAYEKRASEHRAQQAYNAERQRWREAAEVACEPIWQARLGSVATGAAQATAALTAEAGAAAAPTSTAGDLLRNDASPAHPAAKGAVPEGAGPRAAKHKRAERIDRQIHRLAQAMAERDLELGRLLLRFHAADGWRRLGFASFSQYARERLGMSYSSVKARVVLARRALRLPELADAVSERRIGFEAAMLIARVASSTTVAAWIDRASERTLKHLAEEVEAAGMLQRLALASEVEPPSELRMAELLALRGKIMATTGSTIIMSTSFGDVASAQQLAIEELKAWARRALVRQVPAAGSLDRMSDGQMSACADEPASTEEPLPRRLLEGRGRSGWRMRVDGETLSFFRAFEHEFRRHSVRGFGFVRYLCLAFWNSWWRSTRDAVADAEIYQRDAHCCASPVCRRHDVTPHHLEFRSRGGGDEAENLLSLCVWCHLYGVHEGRLSVRPPASAPYWEIGSLRVQGRRRLAA